MTRAETVTYSGPARAGLVLLACFVLASVALQLRPLSAASADVYEISRIGTSDTYRSTYIPTGSFTDGTLKSLVETAVYALTATGGGEVRFTSGDFDLGADFFVFQNIQGIRFTGQGIDVTTIRNVNSGAFDTEPFDVTVAFDLILRDFTISAGGSSRSTSDAIDFDNGNNILIERVKITSSRARGIVFDGKNDMFPQAADGNVVRDCVIQDVPSDGIELLASSNNLIDGCQISGVGGHGIQLTKSSTSAALPNKKSNNNVIRGNVIANSGEDGINVNSSDRNQITGNSIVNSGRAGPGHNGVRITSANGRTCDENVVDLNTATDNQVTKTQSWGVIISSSLCSGTVIHENELGGNLTGELRDLGTGTVFPPDGDSESPTQPTNLLLSAVPAFDHVDLGWDASSDNIAVVAYRIRRDGNVVATVESFQRSYRDTSVAPLTTYTYTVEALDTALNVSPPSPPVDATTPGVSQTASFVAEADAHVVSTSADANFGTSSTLRLDGSPMQRAYLRFDVSGVGGHIASAKLVLTPASNHNSGLEAHLSASGWDELGVTFATAPAVGALLSASGPLAAGVPTVLDVTPAITGSGQYSFVLTPTSNTALVVGSRESSTPPLLIVEFDGVGNAPPAASDSFLMLPFESPSVGWTASVTDTQANALTCTIVTPPAHGAATIDGDCTLGASGTYAPAAGYSGSDSFTYEASDGELTDRGVISVAVQEPPQAPVGADQSVSTILNVSKVITLSATDANGDCPLTFSTPLTSAHGTLSAPFNATCASGEATASVTFTPTASYLGPDAFEFTVSDPGNLVSSPATIAITVVAPPSTITLDAVDDAFVRESEPTRNFGSSPLMRVDGAAPVERSYLRFNVTGVVGVPSSVKLRIYANSSHSVGFETFQLADNAWTEGSLTWENAPAAGTLIGVSGPLSAGTYVEVDVTAYVGGNGSAGFMLGPINGTAMSLGSRESANGPQLVITY